MSARVALVALTLALGSSVACERSNGESKAQTPSTAERPATKKRPLRSTRPLRPPAKPFVHDPKATAASDSGVALDATAAVAVAPPVLTGPDGGALGQTEDEPKTSSPYFRRQAEQLFRAIVEDDPRIARSFFFPLVAYQQVKAIANPERDWNKRLIAAYERDIHAYHEKLGKDATRARFVELYVPEGGARWMKPGSEGNKLGYFRVLRSQLKYLDAAGKDQSLEITSLISWRGEWYVVHVNGFK